MQLVVAMDYSECSRRACAWAAAHGPKLGVTEVTFVHVCDTLALHALEAELQKLRALVDDVWRGVKGVTKRTSVLHGKPADELVRAAEEHGAFAIVMGTNSRTGLDRLLLGSVAEQVVRLAACTVIIVKPETP